MGFFINGQRAASSSNVSIPVLNPSDGSTIDSVPDGNQADANTAIEAASIAFEQWRSVPMNERATILKSCTQAMRDSADELSTLLHQELGRPLPGCLAEIESSAKLLDIYAEEGIRLKAEMPLGSPAGEMTIITREPMGVVIAITPFNFPITLLLFKVGAALIAGCTVVAKPSEDTPLSTLRLAEIFANAGLPPGVFNVVTGRGKALGQALITHPVPRKIAFTGGIEAGRAIAAAAMGTIKHVTLELGGHCPALVCDDANIDTAAAAIARHGFANSGQFCYRVNRVYVDASIYDAFLEALLKHVKQLTLAPAGGTGHLGPLINQTLFSNSVRQVDDATGKNARILCGGERQSGAGFDQGYYFQPTLIADATADMLVMQEETFGPVLGIAKVANAEQGLALCNDSPYGLAGFVFCRDLAKGLTLCERMEAGLVWLNDIQRSSHYVPFGGMKQSGLGREKGRYGVESYLEYKTMYLSYEAHL